MKLRAACGVVWAGMILAFAGQAGAAREDAPALDTPAQAAVKKLPKEVVNAPAPRRFATRDSRNDEITNAVQMEEIRVYGQVDPEDYARRNTAMQQFRNRLEKERTYTPKEKTQMVLCLIGLCGMYGPEGIPLEPSVEARNEARKDQSTLQLSNQFRGTLQ